MDQPAGDRSGPGPLRIIRYRELDLITAAAARSLHSRGIQPGERVALRLASGPTYPILLLALLRAGAIAVPLSTRLPASAVPGLLERIGCRILIMNHHGLREAAAGIETIDAAELLAWIFGQPLLTFLLVPTQASARKAPVDEVVLGSAADLPPFDPAADATIVFTSGSTGVPKAAVHSFQSHWASAAGSNRNIPLRPGDRWLLSLPLWHVGGIAVLFRCLLGGAAVAIAARDEPLADAIAAFGATHVSLVATQLYRLLREERGRAALTGLKAVLLGGGPAPASLVEEAARAGVRLVASYGSTEMASQATATHPGDPPEALRTAGRPLPFRELTIAADGEILVRGRTLFRGYLEPSGLRTALDPAGWFHSGDLGHLDADGRLVVAGRRDAMFVSGGENIHPEEIEREILRYPGVLEAIVVPVPDAEFGARPAAFLRTVDGRLPDPEALGRFLRATLPGFKVPVRYRTWPAGDEGIKPDRRALAAMARTDPETDPE